MPRFEFYGFKEYSAMCDRMGLSIGTMIESTLNANGKRIANELTSGLAKYTSRHHRRSHSTGTTRESIRREPAKQIARDCYMIRSGFALPEGLPGKYINKGGLRKNRGRMPRGGFIAKALSEKKAQEMQNKLWEEFKAKGGK